MRTTPPRRITAMAALATARRRRSGAMLVAAPAHAVSSPGHERREQRSPGPCARRSSTANASAGPRQIGSTSAVADHRTRTGRILPVITETSRSSARRRNGARGRTISSVGPAGLRRSTGRRLRARECRHRPSRQRRPGQWWASGKRSELSTSYNVSTLGYPDSGACERRRTSTHHRLEPQQQRRRRRLLRQRRATTTPILDGKLLQRLQPRTTVRRASSRMAPTRWHHVRGRRGRAQHVRRRPVAVNVGHHRSVSRAQPQREHGTGSSLRPRQRSDENLGPSRSGTHVSDNDGDRRVHIDRRGFHDHRDRLRPTGNGLPARLGRVAASAHLDDTTVADSSTRSTANNARESAAASASQTMVGVRPSELSAPTSRTTTLQRTVRSGGGVYFGQINSSLQPLEQFDVHRRRHRQHGADRRRRHVRR